MNRKWGSAYLDRSFFHMLGETMADRVLLVVAEEEGAGEEGAWRTGCCWQGPSQELLRSISGAPLFHPQRTSDTQPMRADRP